MKGDEHILEIFPVYMSTFKQERTIRVYLPHNYSKNDNRYPVLYMHDGQYIFRDEDSIRGVSLGMEDYLDQNELEVIVVGIDFNPTGEERVNEYCPWPNGKWAREEFGANTTSGGRGDEYVEFIVKELKPLIDQKYRTMKENSTMVGISLGGHISIYAASKYPKIFKKIAILSPAFYRNQEEIENLLRASNLTGLDGIYMDIGTNEAIDDEKISKMLLDSSKAVYEILNEKVADMRFEILNGAEHDYLFFRKRVPALLSFLFDE